MTQKNPDTTEWIKWSDLKVRQCHQARARFPHLRRHALVDSEWGVENGEVVACKDPDGDVETLEMG